MAMTILSENLAITEDSGMEGDLNSARIALKSFMIDLKSWEVDFYRKKMLAINDGGDVKVLDDEARVRLTEILEKWAVSDKTNRGRLIDLGCSDPPTYDPESDVEEDAEIINKDAVITVRQMTGMKTLSRFTLSNKEGAWKIKKKEYLNYKDKWQRSVL
ncbi:NTF2 fold immunity protein [Burkholderia ubonensis]|uniref:NTF2 fold immunity protein n=1 Tax=Burkholderia ubonensis TaxID=101571 RepID=UPI0012FAE0AF|nr:NTF2 fold immunity protein [Burkholderia ubonensis]